MAYRDAKDYEKALQSYQQALNVAKDGRLREYEWIVLSDIGAMYEDMGHLKQAAAQYQQALTVVRQLGNKEAEKQLRDSMARVGKQSGTAPKPGRKR
jgi:tetratricopeptide (TPR) repeat protein